MAKIVFEISGIRADGCKLYRLCIDGVPVRDGLTIDEVIAAIHDRDEERLGEDHGPRGRRKAVREPEVIR